MLDGNDRVSQVPGGTLGSGKRDRSGKRDKKREAGQVRYWQYEAGGKRESGKRGEGSEAGEAGQVRYWQYGQAEKSPDLAISDMSRFPRRVLVCWAPACTDPSPVAALALRPSGACQRYQSPRQRPGPPRGGRLSALSTQPLSTGGCGRGCLGFWVFDFCFWGRKEA